MAQDSEQVLPFSQSRLGKKIGGAVFGLFVGGVATSSIWSGATFVFPGAADWGFTFWGTHHITRVLGGLIGVGIGSFVAGCIAKDRGGRWGLISASPRVALWVTVGFLGIHSVMREYITPLTIGQWIVIAALIVLIPLVAYHAGKAGQETRVRNQEFFESRKGTLLGMKWYYWFWFFFPVHMVGLLATYSVYQIMIYLTVILRSLLWFFFVGLLMEPLLLGSIYLLGLSVYKTYMLLSIGSEMGFNRSQIAKRVLWWTVGIFLIVGSMQTLANLVMRLY